MLQSLGASAAGALVPSRGLAPASARLANRAQIVDFDFDATPYLTQFKNAGVKTIGRYYDRAYGTGIGEVCYHHKSKTLTKAELTAIERAGMFVYVIFQHCNHSCANFDMANPPPPIRGARTPSPRCSWRAISASPRTRRSISASISIRIRQDCAMPAARIWPSVEEYFSQINEVFAQTRWQVGVYGAGVTCKRLKESGKAKFFWLSTSLGHARLAGVLQRRRMASLSERHRNQAPLRARYVRHRRRQSGAAYFGAWTSRGPAPRHDPEVATAILAAAPSSRKAA